jgi:hypothetical protein
MSKLTVEVEIRPFEVPGGVTVVGQPGQRQDGLGTALTSGFTNMVFPLSSLSSETLDALCRQFRNEVFKRAGKEQPPECVEVRTLPLEHIKDRFQHDREVYEKGERSGFALFSESVQWAVESVGGRVDSTP